MSEKDIRFDNVVKTLYPPLLYVMLQIIVEAGLDLYLFVKQTNSVNNTGGSFMSSYRFFEMLDNRLEQYSYRITLITALLAVAIFGILFIRDCSVNNDYLTAYRFKGATPKDWVLIAGTGLFAGTGLSRFVCLLPLENVKL